MNKHLATGMMVLMIAAGAASADVVEESFDNTLYTQGNLDAQAPSIAGFTDEWRTFKSSEEVDLQKFGQIATGLSYTDGTNTLVTSDGAAQYSSTYNTNYRIERELASPSAPSAYYASYLLSAPSNMVGTEASFGYIGGRGVMITLRPQNDDTIDVYATGNNLDLLVAEDIATDTGHMFVVWAADNPNGDGDDEVKVWMNPTDLTDEAANSYVEHKGSYVNYSQAPQTMLAMISNGNVDDGSGAIFDEARYGLTWADVTPIPEPATMALLGIGGLGVLLKRKR